MLSKKENDFEDLETSDLVNELTEVDATENQPDQIETVADNQPPIHEPSIDTQCDIKHRWHIDEKELEKLPSRNLPKIATTLAEAIGGVLPRTLHKQESVPKKEKRSRGEKDLGRALDDFEPDLQYAIDKGLTHDEALLEFERFKLHWKAKPCRNAKNCDWQSTWYGWVINQNGTLAKKLEKEKQVGSNNERFPTNQRVRGGTGEAIRNLIGATQLSDASTKYRATDGKMCNAGVSMDLERWRSIDANPRETSFRSLSDSSKLACFESYY